MFVLWIKTIGMFLWTFFRWMPTNIILFFRRNFPLKWNQNHQSKNFSVENIRFYLIPLATYLCSDFNLRTILIGTLMYMHVCFMKKKTISSNDCMFKILFWIFHWQTDFIRKLKHKEIILLRCVNRHNEKLANFTCATPWVHSQSTLKLL